MSDKADSAPWLLTVTGWFVLACVSVLGILPWARIKFPVVDLGEMVFEVRRVELGFVPYRDTFSHHFLGYILPFYLLGSIVRLTPTVLKAASVCFNIATAILVAATVRRTGGQRAAWLSAFLAVTVGWFWSWQGFGFNVQAYLVPVLAGLILLVVLACLTARPSTLYGAAISCGVLFVFDQRAVVFLALLAIPFFYVAAFRHTRVVLLAVFWLVSGPVAGVYYLWRVGAWNDFVEQAILFPLFHRNQGVPFVLHAELRTWLGTWLGGERIVVPAMFLGLATAWQTERRSPIKAIWLTSFAGAAAYAALGGRPYPNYFMIFAPIALVLSSLLPGYLAASWPSLGNLAAAALVVLGIFCAARPGVLWAATGSPFLAPTESTVDAAVTYVRARTSTNDPILVWGFAPAIYVMSDRFHTFRDAGLLSITGANFGSSSSDQQGWLAHMVREFDNYLRLTPPRLIVVYAVTKEPCPGGVIQRNLDYRSAPQLSVLRDLIATSYRSAITIDGACDHAEIFTRR